MDIPLQILLEIGTKVPLKSYQRYLPFNMIIIVNDKVLQLMWNLTQNNLNSSIGKNPQVPRTESIPLRIATMMSKIEYENKYYED